MSVESQGLASLSFSISESMYVSRTSFRSIRSPSDPPAFSEIMRMISESTEASSCNCDFNSSNTTGGGVLFFCNESGGNVEIVSVDFVFDGRRWSRDFQVAITRPAVNRPDIVVAVGRHESSGAATRLASIEGPKFVPLFECFELFLNELIHFCKIHRDSRFDISEQINHPSRKFRTSVSPAS